MSKCSTYNTFACVLHIKEGVALDPPLKSISLQCQYLQDDCISNENKSGGFNMVQIFGCHGNDNNSIAIFTCGLGQLSFSLKCG